MPSQTTPRINILFYCDDSSTNFTHVPPGQRSLRLQTGDPFEFGLGILKEQIQARSLIPAYVIDVLNRNFNYNPDGTTGGPSGPNKLSPGLLSKYDQVWFFGQHLANFTQPHFDRLEGGPASELDDNEVAALTNWMNQGGGVLMTGDHSNHVDAADIGDLVDPNNQLAGQILNLGRALGHRVPRAGKMRIWVGPPGKEVDEGIVDTSGDTNMTLMPNQEDPVPQNIATRVIDFKVGKWTLGRKRHPLFVRHVDDPLMAFLGVDVFPDHGHEGALTTPPNFKDKATGFDPPEWPIGPSGTHPIPETVAIGTNKSTQSNGEAIALVAAYYGQAAGVGNIVADSTWHHYVNVNLHGFLDATGAPTEVMQKIGDYYENLIWYLCPPQKRLLALRSLIDFARSMPTVREVATATANDLGRQALTVLGDVIQPEIFDDLIESAVFSDPKKHGLVRPPKLLPPRALLLGTILNETRNLRERAPDDSGGAFHEAVRIAAKKAAQEYRAELSARIDALEGPGKDN